MTQRTQTSHRAPGRRARPAAIAAFVALVALAPLPTAAQGGPPPLRVIVELDVHAVPEARLPSRRALVSQRARIHGMRETLERGLRGSGARVLRRYDTLPFVVLEVPHEAMLELATSGAVARIEGDRVFETTLAESTELVQAATVQSLGFDGSGWHVAVLDTGVETDHPALAGRTDAEACFALGEFPDPQGLVGDCPDGSPQQTGPGSAAPCNVERCYHGTHVAGIAIGDDATYTGVAPGARLIAVQVFSEFGPASCSSGEPCALAFTSDIIRGLEHVYGLRDQHQIASVNLSLGGGAYTSQGDCDAANGFILSVIDDLRGAGIATVIASGNDGYVNALSAPGCLSSAVSVGSVTKAANVSSFSNSADFLDLLAPGSLIVSAFPGQTFATLSGTSMATPHVAGAWALYRQQDDQASVDEILASLQVGGAMVLDPDNGLEHPLIQLEADFVPEVATALPGLLALAAVAGRRRRVERRLAV